MLWNLTLATEISSQFGIRTEISGGRVSGLGFRV